MAEALGHSGPPVSMPRCGALGPFADRASLQLGRGDGCELAELVPPGAINLQGDANDHRFVRKAGAVLGCVLPTAPNSVQTAAEVTVVWLGPDEWLVLTAPGAETAMAQGLEQGLADTAASIVDVSGNRVLLRLRGAGTREVLAKGCPLDLHPRVFKPGQCAQTVLARTSVILHQIDDVPTFDLYPRRSFAGYLAAWLADAMAEDAPGSGAAAGTS
jgi:sarcosine oxidase subunit gamma